jgi:Ni/Fe-hydrogenase subunit HybB-like protein
VNLNPGENGLLLSMSFPLPVIITGLALIVWRFANGLVRSIQRLTGYPWGLWKGFNVVTGVAFAGGAYVLTFMVYILKMHKYHPVIRVTVFNGFLAYMFYAGAWCSTWANPGTYSIRSLVTALVPVRYFSRSLAFYAIHFCTAD